VTRRDLARRMAQCCRQLSERGITTGQDGNVSARVGRDGVLVTLSGVLKSGLTGADMVEVDWTGRRRRGRRNPTSELDLHLRILRRRPDVGAVVHAHPPTATAFAVAREGFTSFVLPELIFLVGPVPDEAWIRMETLEHAARILFGARVLGRVTALDPGAVAQLEALRARSLRERDV